jgi:hypothetical protein
MTTSPMIDERLHLFADLRHVQNMLDNAAPEDLIDRMSLQWRIDAIRAELARLDPPTS